MANYRLNKSETKKVPKNDLTQSEKLAEIHNDDKEMLNVLWDEFREAFTTARAEREKRQFIENSFDKIKRENKKSGNNESIDKIKKLMKNKEKELDNYYKEHKLKEVEDFKKKYSV